MAKILYQEILRQSSADTWKAWKIAHSLLLPDLYSADLSGADLSNYNLSGVELSDANLHHCRPHKGRPDRSEFDRCEFARSNLELGAVRRCTYHRRITAHRKIPPFSDNFSSHNFITSILSTLPWACSSLQKYCFFEHF